MTNTAAALLRSNTWRPTSTPNGIVFIKVGDRTLDGNNFRHLQLLGHCATKLSAGGDDGKLVIDA
eukprot:2526992-Pyramimonas_sp.AAC.1